MELATAARALVSIKWRTSVMICEALRRPRRVDARVRNDRGPIREGWSALRSTRDRDAGDCARQGKDWRVQMREVCRRRHSGDLEVISGDVDGAVYFPHVRLPAAVPSPHQHQVGTIAGR